MDTRVGIADLNIVSAPGRLITIGLGSCIGIAVYDRQLALAGLAHIMLPCSEQFSQITNPLKFADLAVPELINRMKLQGAVKERMLVKIAGGASMFSFADSKVNMDIGERNGKAVIQALDKLKIPIVAMDIGGTKGRTMIIDAASGVVQIKTLGAGIKEL